MVDRLSWKTETDGIRNWCKFGRWTLDLARDERDSRTFPFEAAWVVRKMEPSLPDLGSPVSISYLRTPMLKSAQSPLLPYFVPRLFLFPDARDNHNPLYLQHGLTADTDDRSVAIE